MRKLLFVSALFYASIGFTSTAKAGVMLEPYLGFATGKLGDKATGKSDGSGPYYGARVAFSTLGFFVGGEYQGSSLKIDTNPKSDGTTTDIGATAGYEFPILLRVYATYFVDSQLKMKVSGTNYTYKGSAMKLGIGWTAFPLVAFNLEYYTPTYTKLDGTTLSSDYKVSGNLTMLNVSIPLSF